jgi:hypothetical protein
LAIVGGSFQWLARRVFLRGNARKLGLLVPAVAFLAACGGSSQPEATRIVAGNGYRFEVPQAGWVVSRRPRVTAVRDGDRLVSVTTFPLVHSYDPAMFDEVVPELDRVANEVAVREQAKVANGRTLTIAGRKARVYDIAHDGGPEERIAFVLSGPREYQLFCRDAGDVCDGLLRSFSLG